jgi:hypothetical protein
MVSKLLSDYYIQIGLLSSVVWFLIPFFQYKSKYFFYFSVLGASGLYSILFFIVPLPVPSRTILAVAALIIPALYRDFFTRHIYILIGLGVILFYAAFLITIPKIQIIGLLGFIIAEILLGRQVISEVKKARRINVFYLLIIIYGLLNIIKLTSIIQYVADGLTVYFLITLFQSIIGIVLMFLNENNPKIIIRVNSH